VCPWNRGIERRRADEPLPSGAEPNVSLVEWLQSDPADLRARYQRLYVPRNDGRYLHRNALVALGNAGGPEHRALAEELAESDDELVREHALWAIRRIDERTA
jgi:epoxyqueuosine reductase